MNTKNFTHIEKINLEIAFLIKDSIYYGPDNNFTQIQWKSLRELVYAPKYNSYKGYIFLTEIIKDDASELIKYYKDVIRVKEKYKKKFSSLDFCVRPLIYFNDNDCIYFPWNDSYEDSNRFLQMISSKKEGDLYDDIDQSWSLLVQSDKDNLYFIETNGEFGEEEEILNYIKTEKKYVQERAQYLISELDIIVKKLVLEFQENYWSRNFK